MDHQVLRFEKLIVKAKEGSVPAFSTLFDALVDRLYAYALSRTGSTDAAEDTVQETFVELWTALPRFEYQGDAQFIGFVYTILRRKVAWHYQDNRRHAHDPIEEHDGDSEIASPLPAHDESRYIGRLMSSLSDTYREVIHLRYWGALSFAEIAATLEMDENTARVTHHRALKRLQELHLQYE